MAQSPHSQRLSFQQNPSFFHAENNFRACAHAACISGILLAGRTRHAFCSSACLMSPAIPLEFTKLVRLFGGSISPPRSLLVYGNSSCVRVGGLPSRAAMCLKKSHFYPQEPAPFIHAFHTPPQKLHHLCILFLAHQRSTVIQAPKFPKWNSRPLLFDGPPPHPERLPAILHSEMTHFEALGYLFSSKIQDVVVIA